MRAFLQQLEQQQLVIGDNNCPLQLGMTAVEQCHICYVKNNTPKKQRN